MSDARTITFAFPKKNALDSAVMEWLRAELKAAGGAPVILTNEGDAFSAGLDLAEVAAFTGDDALRFLDLLEAMTRELALYPGPTVAAVQGHAIAGGCVLALACDVRVLTDSPRARVGLNEVALGLRFPPTILRLAQLRLSAPALEEVVLGAGLHPPPRALALGLVDELAAAPLAVAKERLAARAAHPADAYRATKLALRVPALAVTEEERSRFARDALPSWASQGIKDKIAGVLARPK